MMKRGGVLTIGVVLSGGFAALSHRALASSSGKISVDGREHAYLLHDPPSYNIYFSGWSA
jgi:hypothetical protein